MESRFISRYTRCIYIYFFNGTYQDAPETTTLLTSDKFKEDPTAEMLWMNYNYGHIPCNSLQFMSNNGVIPKRLADCNFPSAQIFYMESQSKSLVRPKRQDQ